mmetsp:Transcript_12303/g.29461  ORF Transcript_12303/g.29461 Transcript_12303/m.29461 type:complete len:213 (-) Transcript_12303:822-1460(-)
MEAFVPCGEAVEHDEGLPEGHQRQPDGRPKHQHQIHKQTPGSNREVLARSEEVASHGGAVGQTGYPQQSGAIRHRVALAASTREFENGAQECGEWHGGPDEEGQEERPPHAPRQLGTPDDLPVTLNPSPSLLGEVHEGEWGELPHRAANPPEFVTQHLRLQTEIRIFAYGDSSADIEGDMLLHALADGEEGPLQPLRRQPQTLPETGPAVVL